MLNWKLFRISNFDLVEFYLTQGILFENDLVYNNET